MRAAVVIPWWPGTDDPWRIRWLADAEQYWAGLGYPVHYGEGREGAAINAGIGRANAHVIIVPMCDSVIPPLRAAEAVELAGQEPGLVVPHDRYVYLSQNASAAVSMKAVAEVLAEGGRWPGSDLEFSGPLSVGGPVVFSKRTWEQAGGYDPTLVRAYDGAFALACHTLVAPQRRMPGDFVHLWHPRPVNEDPPETWETMRAYHEAAEAGADAMRALVAARAAA